ncbi:MAG: GvpL/GvpF family gas vesicle protein, partial [Bacteroidota bacterium]
AFPSREAIRSHLASSGPVWREALGRVRGGVEFSLGFSLPVETVSGDPEAAEGYLRRRKDAMEAKQAIADRVRETGERIASTLSRLAMAAMPPRLGKGGALGEITVLVARAEANAFVERVASIGHGLSARPSITVKGPWPPYSFATVGD